MYIQPLRASAWRNQQRALDPSLRIVCSYHLGAGNRTWVQLLSLFSPWTKIFKWYLPKGSFQFNHQIIKNINFKTTYFQGIYYLWYHTNLLILFIKFTLMVSLQMLLPPVYAYSSIIYKYHLVGVNISYIRTQKTLSQVTTDKYN